MKQLMDQVLTFPYTREDHFILLMAFLNVELLEEERRTEIEQSLSKLQMKTSSPTSELILLHFGKTPDK